MFQSTILYSQFIYSFSNKAFIISLQQTIGTLTRPCFIIITNQFPPAYLPSGEHGDSFPIKYVLSLSL